MHIRRRTAALAATTLTIGLLGAVPAAADHVEARPLEPACEGAPEDGLTDAGPDGGEQETAVDCLAWYEVTQGRTATTYDPRGQVIRGEMAAFLARVMRASETPFAEPGETEDYFLDDNGGIFEDDINFVAKHGVAEGTSETEFSPGQRVRRGEMAKFLVTMLEAVGAEIPEPTQDYFDDDNGNMFEEFINRVAELGVAAGVSETSYAPAEDVDRGQMARFIARSMAELAAQDLLVSPAAEEPVATDAPELVAVSDTVFHSNSSCTSTDGEDDAEYVELTAEFDEAITGRSVPEGRTGFSLVGFDASRTSPTTARLSTADDSQAELCFAIDAWTTATTLAVAADAVEDVGNLGNPEGAVGVKSVTLSGTTAPELTTVSSESATQVRFVFDEPVDAASASGYRLVAADGSQFASTAATISNGDVIATFPDYSDATIARAAALDGAATSASDDDTNAVSVIDTTTGGFTSAPDLANVVYVPDATRERDIADDEELETVEVDEVRFVFDVSVLEQDSNTDKFVLVTANGDTLTPLINPELEEGVRSGDPVDRSTADGRVVIVEFPDGALQTATGAAVLDNAVRAAAGDQPVNRVDAQARDPQLTYAAGTTLAPSPVEATLSSTTLLLTTTYTVTVTFDEPVAVPVEDSTIHVYDAAGNAHALTAAQRDEDDHTVVQWSVDVPAGEDASVLEAAVLVGLTPDAVQDDGGHGNHAQVIEL